MGMITWLVMPDDMEWLQSTYGAPAGLKCAVLEGNEDSPILIEGWFEFNPDYGAHPDWVYIPDWILPDFSKPEIGS